MLPMLLSAFLFISDPAASGAQPVQASAEAPKKERKVCRDTERTTGSNRVKRVCKTPTEWAKFNEDYSAEDIKTMGSH